MKRWIYLAGMALALPLLTVTAYADAIAEPGLMRGDHLPAAAAAVAAVVLVTALLLRRRKK